MSLYNKYVGNKIVINREVNLTRRSAGDRIRTFSTSQLEIKGQAPKYSCWEIGFRGGVAVTAYSNRKDGSSLKVRDIHLPRAITLPNVSRNTTVIVSYVRRVY